MMIVEMYIFIKKKVAQQYSLLKKCYNEYSLPSDFPDCKMYIRCLICLPFPHQSFTILQVKFGRIENTTKSAPCQHKFRLVIVTVHPTLFKHAELMINPFLHMLMMFMCKKCMKVDKTSRMALQNLEIGNALEIKPNCKDGTTSTMFFLRLECILYRVLVSNIFYFHPCLGKIPILTSIFQRV